jgi:hypothetical protein
MWRDVDYSLRIYQDESNLTTTPAAIPPTAVATILAAVASTAFTSAAIITPTAIVAIAAATIVVAPVMVMMIRILGRNNHLAMRTVRGMMMT